MAKSKKNKAIEVGDDEITVVISEQELETLASLLVVCAETFENIAMQAMSQKDEHTTNIFAARSKLAAMYADKLKVFKDIGEPTSRDFH